MSVMNKKLYPLFAVFLLGTMLVGCADDFDRNFEFDEYTPSVIMQAKQLIESGNVKVSLLDLENAYLSEKEKQAKANAKADFSIRWSDYRVKTEGTVDVVYVPIKINKKKTQAFTLHTDDGRMKGFSNQYYCTLIMVAGKNGKGFDAIMATYLYGGNMKGDDVKRMGRDFESAGYTGYYITSNLDGTMLAGRYIEDGETKFGFRQNPLSPSKRKEVKTETESDTINKHNHNHDNHRLFLNINPFKYAKKTKSDSDMEWFMTHCSICGELWSDCTCVEIYPECEYCHTDIVSGRCSHACTVCDLCMYGPYHSHYYGPQYGDYTPITPGSGGGGTYWGGDPDPEPVQYQYGLSYQADSAKINHAAKSGVDYVLADDKIRDPLTAKCNKGVKAAFMDFFNVTETDLPSYMKKRANEMIKEGWITDTNNWQEIKESDYSSKQEWLNKVQELADKGYFVVSGWINTTPMYDEHGNIMYDNDGNIIYDSGHVTVIVPSCGQAMEPSSNFNFCNVPWSMDTGPRKRTVKQKISGGYGPDKAPYVRFFYHK